MNREDIRTIHRTRKSRTYRVMIEVSFKPGELPSGTGTSGEVPSTVESVVQYICLQRPRVIVGLRLPRHMIYVMAIPSMKLGWLSWLERRSHSFTMIVVFNE